MDGENMAWLCPNVPDSRYTCAKWRGGVDDACHQRQGLSTTLMKRTPCQGSTARPKRTRTKRYVDILIPGSWSIEAGRECGRIVGQAFDSEGVHRSVVVVVLTLTHRYNAVRGHGEDMQQWLAAHCETHIRWRKRRTGHPDMWVRLCFMQAVLEACTVKINFLGESKQYSSGATNWKLRSWDAKMVTTHIAWQEMWVTCCQVVNLVPGCEPVVAE